MKIVLAAIVAVAALVSVSVSAAWRSSALQPTRNPPTTPVLICAQIGIRPEAFVLAGLQPADATAMLERLQDVPDDRAALDSAVAADSDARTERARLVESLRANPASEQLRQALSAQDAACAAAALRLEQARASLWSSAFEGVSSDAVRVCAAVRDTMQRGLPAEAAVTQLSREETRQLLRAVRTNAEIANPAAAAAHARLRMELPAMLAVFATP